MNDVKGSRREKAALTRLRILDAAALEFAENGYHGATIASIARRAGVAPQTIYFVFHTKSALISALIDRLVMGDDPVVPQQTEWWAAMVAAPDAASALRHFVVGAGPLFSRASMISEILRAAALTDAEVQETHEMHEQLRREGFREVIDLLATKGSLKEGLTPERATDVMLVVYGDATHVLFTRDHGWSHDEYVAWVSATLPGLLLEDAD